MSRAATLPEQAVFPVQVFYEDTDAGGVVYHANYLRYFERARSLWMETFGLSHSHLAQTLDIGFVVAHADIQFKAPARLDDRLQVSVAVRRMRAASIIFEQLIRRHETLLVKAQFTVACVKLSRFAPCELPAVLRAGERRSTPKEHE